MKLRVKSLVFVVLLLVTVSSPKTLESPSPQQAEDDSGHKSEVLAFLGALATSSGPQEDYKSWIGAMILPKVLGKVKENGRQISEVLGVSEDFMKPLLRLIDGVEKLQSKDGKDNKGWSKAAKTKADRGVLTNSVDEEAGEDMTSKFVSLAKDIFLEEFGGLDTLLPNSGTEEPLAPFPALNLTSISLWEVMRTTWARILSYVEEQNGLDNFMQRTPVKIIDRVLSLGDDLNLASFLAKKLDPEFAEFLAAKAEPLLGPLRDADSLANLTQAVGLGDTIAYLTSPRVKHTLYTLAGLVSAHLENRVNSDLARQFLEFMSLDNVELGHFYRALVGGEQQQQQQEGEGDRARRSVLDHIASTFEYDRQQAEDQVAARALQPEDQMMEDDALSARMQNMQEMMPRDGGYGSSYGGYGGHSGGYGYGYSNTLDPYVVLGALALGTLLGFLLFRLIRGTARGRRDINDGSLSLWQSDVPYVDQSRALRAERAAPTNGSEGLSLSPLLHGEKWSSAPLVGEETSTGLSVEEDDLADHLNQLWRAHSGNDSATCVRSRLCRQLTGPETAHAGLALLLSSTASLLGVVGSGQMLDKVTGSLTGGDTFTCPASCPLRR